MNINAQKIFVFLVTLLALAVAVPEKPAYAEGTAAGTLITNLASVNFSMDGGRYSEKSNIVSTRVDEIVRVNLEWKDATTVTVIPGEINQYMTLVITNTGNGTETFDLSADTTLPKDDFDPIHVGLFIDSNFNRIFEPSVDLPLSEGIELAADQTAMVFVVNNIPEVGYKGKPLQDKDIGDVKVSVTSAHGDGPTWTVFPGDGDAGGTAIFGNEFAQHIIGQYVIKAIYVSIAKSAVIDDHLGGNAPYPGATITYTLEVNATGSGIAHNLVITDPIPANTTYQTGSLTLDGSPLTDEDDDDTGKVSGTPVNLVSVDLGDQGNGHRIITFKVTINE